MRIRLPAGARPVTAAIASLGMSVVLAAAPANAGAANPSSPKSFESKEVTVSETGDYLQCYPLINGVCGSSTGPGGGWAEYVTQVNDTYDFKDLKLQQQQNNPSQYFGGAWPTTIVGTEHHERAYTDQNSNTHDCQWDATLGADPTHFPVGTLTVQAGANPPSTSLYVGSGILVSATNQSGDCGDYDGFHIGPDTTESDSVFAQGSYDPTARKISLNTGNCFHVPPSIGTGQAGGGGECAVSGTLTSPNTDIFDTTLNETVTDGTQHVLPGTGISVKAQGVSDWKDPQWKIDDSDAPPETTAVQSYDLGSVKAPAGVQPVGLQQSDLQGLSAHFFVVAPGTHSVSFTGTDPATGKQETISTTYEVAQPTPTVGPSPPVPRVCPYFSLAHDAQEGYIMALTGQPDPAFSVGILPINLPTPGCDPGTGAGYKLTWSAEMPHVDAGYPDTGDLAISQVIRRYAYLASIAGSIEKYNTHGAFLLDSRPFLSLLVNDLQVSGPEPAPGPITSFDRPSLTVIQPGLKDLVGVALLATGSAYDNVDLRTHLEFKAGGPGADSIWVSLGYVELAYQGREQGLHGLSTRPTLGPVHSEVTLLSAPGTLVNVNNQQPVAVTQPKATPNAFQEGNGRSRISRKTPQRTGTTFSFSLNIPAKVAFSFTRPGRGRTVKGRCVKQTRPNRNKPRCVLTNVAGTLRFNGHPGLNKVRFQGVLPSGRKLKRGRYTLVITAAAASGVSQRALTFTIVKR